MEDILRNDRFAAAYDQLAHVSLNPRRHTATNARAHSDAVASMAARLGRANGCSSSEVALLANLGRAHDIGKITGTARPARSLDALADCGVTDGHLLSLVKWHDTSLPWHRAAQRGEAPSNRAWRRLAGEVDLRLLCLFMVADRVDAPGGWRRNAPTTWFLAQAASRALIGKLAVELDDHPSEVNAGAALVRRTHRGPEVLAIRKKPVGWELPKGGIEWDELPQEAALRALRAASGAAGELPLGADVGQLDCFVGAGDERRLQRVRYFVAKAQDAPVPGSIPDECRWLGREDVDAVPLVDEALRGLLHRALLRV